MRGYRKMIKNQAAVEVKRERQDIGSRDTIRPGSFDSQTGSPEARQRARPGSSDSQTGSPGYRSKTKGEARQLWKSNRSTRLQKQDKVLGHVAVTVKQVHQVTEARQRARPGSSGRQIGAPGYRNKLKERFVKR
ncbi:hypothetical protein PoB_002596300 [Plakobranchus ocellatus]|uniref:Uncharacterized protein n=1 Tax=Plakobranchus ocellatus TaxID=259542 RepID=A0AAV3ZYI3_9GAST|nr:hypothetical protein PoB_002596300 [Plakobranchus ocellatus]